MIKISKRLKALSEYIIKGEAAADIGADHAYFALYLIEQGISPHVVIGEINEGPYQRACLAAKNSPYYDYLSLRKGDGISILENAEVSSVVIAGMGGETITDILANDWEKAESYKRFILQAMSKTEVLRLAIINRGWIIIDEDIIQEEEHYYNIIVCEPAQESYALNDLELEIGSKILLADTDIKKQYLRFMLKKYIKVNNSLEKSLNQEELRKSYSYKIKQLEEIIGESEN